MREWAQRHRQENKTEAQKEALECFADKTGQYTKAFGA